MAERENRFKNMGKKMYSPKKPTEKPEEKSAGQLPDEVPELVDKTEIQKDEPKATPKKQAKKPKTKVAEQLSNEVPEPVDKTEIKPAAGENAKRKRGRQKGSVLVKEEERRKTISISVDPRDERIYKEVLDKYPKRFKGMSQLVEQALDYFINENNLK